MATAPQPVQVFIGSSNEGLRIARTLQSELESATDCTVNRWDTDTFAPGSFALDALLQQANTVDFAILVATGDDTITRRGTRVAAVRDNIISELVTPPERGRSGSTDTQSAVRHCPSQPQQAGTARVPSRTLLHGVRLPRAVPGRPERDCPHSAPQR